MESKRLEKSDLENEEVTSAGGAPEREIPGSAALEMQRLAGNRATSLMLDGQAGQPAGGDTVDVAEHIRRTTGGKPIEEPVQRRLESGLGADLSGVHVHTDANADRLSRAVEAVAFTSGSDIFFRSGAYQPRSNDGMHLLAHEAAHVVQQAKGAVNGTRVGDLVISDPGDADERAADRLADQVVNKK
jgi:hypothetical protein